MMFGEGREVKQPFSGWVQIDNGDQLFAEGDDLPPPLRSG